MSQAMPLATYCKNYTLPRHSFEPVSQFVEDTSWQAESERPIDWLIDWLTQAYLPIF